MPTSKFCFPKFKVAKNLFHLNSSTFFLLNRLFPHARPDHLRNIQQSRHALPKPISLFTNICSIMHRNVERLQRTAMYSRKR
uniref:Ovule protein n=1 Tax=Ascaris lumbricoides TaxID=6252 RepID=A0A0M3IS47_ASCLU